MKSITIVLLLLSSTAFAVSKEECASRGMSFVKEVITRNGVYRTSHCRSKPAPLTDAEKAARIAQAKKLHPNVSVSGQ